MSDEVVESGLSESAQRVVVAAAQVIEEHGEAGVRVQELAHDAGVAVTSIYRYFDSRDGLIEAAQTHRYERVLTADIERVAAEAVLCTSAADAVRLVDGALDRFLTDDRATARMARMNALGSAQSRPKLAEALARAQGQYNRQLAAALEPLQERGWIRPELDLLSTAAWLAGLFLSRLLVEIGPTGADPAQWDAYTRQAVHALLFPTPEL